MNWKDQRVIITGGSSGIGAQLVTDFVEQGAQVVFCGLESEKIKAISEETEALGIAADLTDEKALLSFFEQAVAHLNGVDVLINNAGYVIAEPFEQLKRSDFEQQFAINAIAPAQLAQCALPYFRANGQGDIVNIGATGGQYAFPNGGAYSASKAALSIISKNLALEFRKENIRVFHVDPSWCTGTYNNNRGTSIPADPKKLNPEDITHVILPLLELPRRAFVPQMSVWGTQL